MTTREAKRAIRLREWNQMVKHCQESGLTVNEWCRQNIVSDIENGAYYNSHISRLPQSGERNGDQNI